MSDEILTTAMMRLERAIERVERAADDRAAAGNGMAASLAALEERHGSLRGRVHETIVRLDALIGDDGDG
ncbi:hypothetical protein [uncultured Sphingomonas sp.]|uniref:hypothetical protein n=1 Tax=uncultured Sphingomonas sp. TaxID=158754 RepID=UPI0025DCB740|nr:hypothetical protein [uncultured Sphingomonas sp.]